MEDRRAVARKAARRAIFSRVSVVLRLVPLDFLVLLRLFIVVHLKLLLGTVTALREVSLLTGDLNSVRVRVDRKIR